MSDDLRSEPLTLGLGTATLMRLPRRSDRLAVLEAAWQLGYRHFDTAPLYGHGQAERELGAFLASGPTGGAQVVTKFGRAASRLGRVTAWPRRRLRTSPLRGAAKRVLERGASNAPRPDADSAAVRDGLLGSLDRLGLTSVSALLLHEVSWSDAWSPAWNAMRSREVAACAAGIGVSGPAELLSKYPLEVLATSEVLQVPAFDLPCGVTTSGQLIGYSAFNAVRMMSARLERSTGPEYERLQKMVGEVGSLAPVIAHVFGARFPRATLVVGTTSVVHLRELRQAHDHLGRSSTSIGAADLWTTLRDLQHERGTG